MKKLLILIISLMSLSTYDTLPRINLLSQYNFVAGALIKKERKPDDPYVNSAEVINMFRNKDLTFERLPMIFAVVFNENARKSNLTLDDYLMFMNLAAHFLKAEKELAEEDSNDIEVDKGFRITEYMCSAVPSSRAKVVRSGSILSKNVSLNELKRKMNDATSVARQLEVTLEICGWLGSL